MGVKVVDLEVLDQSVCVLLGHAVLLCDRVKGVWRSRELLEEHFTLPDGFQRLLRAFGLEDVDVQLSSGELDDSFAVSVWRNVTVLDKFDFVVVEVAGIKIFDEVNFVDLSDLDSLVPRLAFRDDALAEGVDLFRRPVFADDFSLMEREAERLSLKVTSRVVRVRLRNLTFHQVVDIGLSPVFIYSTHIAPTRVPTQLGLLYE